MYLVFLFGESLRLIRIATSKVKNQVSFFMHYKEQMFIINNIWFLKSKCVYMSRMKSRLLKQISNIQRLTQSKIQIKLYSDRTKLVLYYFSKKNKLSYTIKFHNATVLFILKEKVVVVKPIFITYVIRNY